MAKKQISEAQNPLILRCNRLIEAFSKSDDERDFYLDKREGYIVYADLDKPSDELEVLEKELKKHPDNYCMIPKLTFYETKKIMEGFIHEKVYDIDTKEKLLDIIQSKEARQNFLEFIHDHHSELEKWQAYYQERSRIRIIEWLRTNGFTFVFEEDLELPKMILEKIKKELFSTKPSKEVANARKSLFAKAKTYYSTEALNPRPKRGRPPKQAIKAEIEPQVAIDIYTTVPNGLRGFLFIPDLANIGGANFSSHFEHEDSESGQHGRKHSHEMNATIENLNTKLQQLRSLTSKWKDGDNIGNILENSPVKPLAIPMVKPTKKINGIPSAPIKTLSLVSNEKAPASNAKTKPQAKVVKRAVKALTKTAKKAAKSAAKAQAKQASKPAKKSTPKHKIKPKTTQKIKPKTKPKQNQKPKQKEKTMTVKAKTAAPKKAAAKKAAPKKATVKKAAPKKAAVKKKAAPKKAAPKKAAAKK